VREADIRYAGQSMEVRVTAPGGAIDAAFLAGLIGAFNAAHHKTFGYNYAGRQKIELVNLCVSGFGLIERPQMPKLARRDGKPAPKSSRAVYFGAAFQDTPVYDRASLPTGKPVDGPAIIEEFGSTTVIFPGQVVEADPHGILVVRPGQSAQEVKP
jgi:N-methylhydantoinase A